jgi:hypothetical protein
MIEFLALRSKAYVYKTKETEAKRLKGSSRNVVNNHITFDDYKDTLFNNKCYYKHKMTTSEYHENEMNLK